MADFNINVTVNVGVTPALESLLTRLFTPNPEAVALDRETSLASIEASRENVRASQKSIEANEAYLRNVQPGQTAEPQPAAVDQPAEEPAAAPAEPAKEYTEVDVRAAMDRARKRIEGENYKEKTDSEGYKKWHKVLSAWFKGQAVFCGAEKPSALPDSESRHKFIQCCDAVYVSEETGELTQDCPF